MRVLVTGGLGFVGVNLIKRLLEDYRACGLAERPLILNLDLITYAANRDALDSFSNDTGYRFVNGDICDSELLRTELREFRPDWVLHLAAESHVDRSISGPAPFIRTNILGTYALLEAAREYCASLGEDARGRFRFIQASTDEVYGALGDDGVFTEESPYRPRSPYSASKAAGDHLVRAWFHTHGLPVLLTHSGNNHGPYQHVEKLIPRAISCALRGEAIPVYGNGCHVRDWIHVDDHVSAIISVAMRGRLGESYCVGGGYEARNLDLVRLLCSILDELSPRSDRRSYAEQISFVADRPGHDFRYASDPSKIRREIGWTPCQDGRLAIRRTVEWYLARLSSVAGSHRSIMPVNRHNG